MIEADIIETGDYDWNW